MTDEDLTQLARDAEQFSVEHLQELFRLWAAAEDHLRVSAHPRFVLETAAVRATSSPARLNPGGVAGEECSVMQRPVDRATGTRTSTSSSEKVMSPKPRKRDTVKSSSDEGAKPVVLSASAAPLRVLAKRWFHPVRLLLLPFHLRRPRDRTGSGRVGVAKTRAPSHRGNRLTRQRLIGRSFKRPFRVSIPIFAPFWKWAG